MASLRQPIVTHIIRSLANRIPNLGIEAIGHVDMGRRLLENPKRLDEWRRETLSWPSNVKVLQRANAVQATGNGDSQVW